MSEIKTIIKHRYDTSDNFSQTDYILLDATLLVHKYNLINIHKVY